MELFNELEAQKEQSVEDFLTFIPIYESKMRAARLKSFLRKEIKNIKGKHCVEAGAGRGIFSEEMLRLGAKSVTAVEQSKTMFEVLKAENKKNRKLNFVHASIETYRPAQKADTLFHEFYGPLVLDETILSLRKLKFRPDTILPDGGTLWAMPLFEKEIVKKDEVYNPSWRKALSGALISDLFTHAAFKPDWKIFDWDVHSRATEFEFTIPARCEWIALCGEITHEKKSVLKLWQTGNWPVIYTPVNGKTFRLSFRYSKGYTRVFFTWVK